ncbi:MAG: antibiotic resistance protein VanZ [Sphaerochaeta sp.]|nr:antibiotic resistance protein VanZ [Sphaerochaeta sp.]
MKERLPLQKILRTLGLVLTVLVVGSILYFSLIPGEKYPNISWIPFADKGDHMVAYAALGFSLFFATLQIPGSGKDKRVKKTHSTLHLTSWSGQSIMLTLLSGSALGICIELIQPMFMRNRDWLDFAADFMGLVVGIALALILLKIVGSYFTTRPWLYDPNWKDEIDEILRKDQ